LTVIVASGRAGPDVTCAVIVAVVFELLCVTVTWPVDTDPAVMVAGVPEVILKFVSPLTAIVNVEVGAEGLPKPSTVWMLKVMLLLLPMRIG